MTAAPRPPHRDALLVGLVALGGAVGSGLRYAVAAAMPPDGGAWPWATLVVNVLGAFLLGWLLEALAMRGPETARLRRWRLFAGTGLLGGFTTYSSLALEAERLAVGGAWGAALAYAVTSVVLGTAAALAGVAAGRATAPRAAGRLLRRSDP